MKLSSIIYRRLTEKSEKAGQEFIRSFNSYRANRRMLFKTDFEMLNGYLIYLFSYEGRSAEHVMRCLCGNRSNQKNWLDDFNTVILPRLVTLLDSQNIGSLLTTTPNNSISELGELLASI